MVVIYKFELNTQLEKNPTTYLKSISFLLQKTVWYINLNIRVL